MAGTCPHCGIHISGHLRPCPACGGHCLDTQEKCPSCGAALDPASPTPSEPEPDAGAQQEAPQPKPYRSKGPALIFLSICLILICGGYYYWSQQSLQAQEQADYERLAELTNPDFYQQFLDEYPDSKHAAEVNERMLLLQAEQADWLQLQKDINRTSVTRFMQAHPQTLRQRICEDILDSIDWQEAQKLGTEEAITAYINNHPAGRYVSQAAEHRNAILLTKVTAEERAMLRSTLETFFTIAVAKRDTAAINQAIRGTMTDFCGTKDADATKIAQYAEAKLAKDVIGLHYLIGQQMEVSKESLPDGMTGYAVAFNLQETISRSDTGKPAEATYRVNARLDQEMKILRMSIGTN